MEHGSEVVSSADPLREYSSSDDADEVSSASSRFSSCEGSELERYASANSVLGTASICSSVGNRSDFLDLFRSAGAGEDSFAEGTTSRERNWRNLRQRDDTLFGRFDGFSDEETDFSADNSAVDIIFPMKMSGLNSLLVSNQAEDDHLHAEGEELQRLESPSRGIPLETGVQSSSDPGLQGSNSVHDRRSEDEESIHDYDGDSQDEGSTIWNGIQNIAVENRKERENPLLMNSSVAFGHNDWDEFERETDTVDLGYLPSGSEEKDHNQAVENPRSQEEEHEYKPVNEYGNGIHGTTSNIYTENSSRISPAPARELETNEEGLTEADEAENTNPSEFFHDMVLEMEEILLDSEERTRARVTQGDKLHHLRDGSSTASTSETDEVLTAYNHLILIDSVEVIGTKQKKGDVSLGERLVGVKEYTVYILKVKSGKNQWVVEHRYRDFLSLYHQLNTLFIDHGLTLPSPWRSVVKESRNYFCTSSPIIISQRSDLIQDCLNSALHFRFSSGHPSPLIWFLQRPGQTEQKISPESFFKLGKTISLILEIKVRKSTGQMLESQRYLCAGCHGGLESKKNRTLGFASNFMWEKNRYCEYTGQLFCSICHTNDSAVLPARVLHHWDFSRYSVSQLAKAFLDSIYDQPMLCVSAVNPFLFSKVPALQQIMAVRKRIASMLPCILCPFRRSILRRLGSRRYLLEENDFFALRDLVDLSKGAFSGLPNLVETVEKKIFVHITQQCLTCYDSGSHCSAGQNCIDPSSIIFPFQESEAVRCSSCQLLFHQPCIQVMGSCPCGKLTPVNGQMLTSRDGVDFELKAFVDSPAETSDAKALSGFFADLVSKARPENLWKNKKTQPVILMGSLTGVEG